MSDIPPTPRSLQNSMSIGTLRTLMARAKRADDDVHNYAKGVFQQGTKIMFKRGGTAYYAIVIGVIGSPGRTRITVEKIKTSRRLDIQLEDITGVVQES